MANQTDDLGNPIGGALESILKPYIDKDKIKREENPNESRRMNVIINSHDPRGTSEFAHDRFSGLRANDLGRRFELWIYGRLHSTLSYADFNDRPQRLNEWYVESFGLKEAELHGETANAIVEVEARKAKKFILEEVMKGKKI